MIRSRILFAVLLAGLLLGWYHALFADQYVKGFCIRYVEVFYRWLHPAYCAAL